MTSSTRYWSTDLPKYCTHCGRPMEERYKKPEGYDSHTGMSPRKREYYWRCPKIKWYSMYPLHDEFLVIEEAEKMIGKYHYRGVLTIMRMGI